ncbi:hypothetical protein AAMO2058_000088000 [Amorphochlora amoebiformis]
MAKKKKKADDLAEQREQTRRIKLRNVLKGLLLEYKVREDHGKELLRSFSLKENQDPPITKVVLFEKHEENSIKALCDAIRGTRYDYLQDLLFVNCGFGDKSAAMIANTLKYTLAERLELRDCLANVHFCEALGEYLGSGRHSRLKRIILDFNPLGSHGIRLITEGLKHNTTLKDLSLQYCEIESKGGKYLGEMLLSPEDKDGFGLKKSLESLNLCGNPLKCAGIGMFAQGLAKNRTLKSLDLENTSFGHEVEATRALAEAISLCSTLTSVNIMGNLISNHGARVLLMTMEHTHHVVDLRITQFVDNIIYSAIKKWTTHNKSLKKPKRKSRGKSSKKKSTKK